MAGYWRKQTNFARDLLLYVALYGLFNNYTSCLGSFVVLPEIRFGVYLGSTLQESIVNKVILRNGGQDLDQDQPCTIFAICSPSIISNVLPEEQQDLNEPATTYRC